MKIRDFIIVFLMIIFLPGKSQNVVPNPSFETYTGCPAGNGAISAGFVSNWNRPPGSIITPDLFTPCTTSGMSCTDFNTGNNCVGSSVPYQGVAYAGFLWYYTGCPNCKEYIVAQLTSVLTNGTVYRASYRTKLGPYCRYGTNRHGLYVSATAPSQPGGNQPILITPTVQLGAQVLDKVNWTAVSGTFTSAGTEQYITIGNFFNDASTSIYNFGSSPGTCIFATGAAYYYIDSVNVVPASILPLEVISFEGEPRPDGNFLSWKIDSDIELNSVWLEHSEDGNGFTQLASYSDFNTDFIQNNFVHTQPNAGKNFYRLGMEDMNGNFSVSEIVEIFNDHSPSVLDLNLKPNPASEIVFLEFDLPGDESQNFRISIDDMNGKNVYSGEWNSGGSFESLPFSVQDFKPGIYFVSVISETAKAIEKLVVIR